MSLKILFDYPEINYRPAEFVTGRVRYLVKEPDHIKICLNLIGEELSSATETTHTGFSSGLKNYFLVTESYVIQSECPKDVEYEFVFNLELPNKMPSSFVGRYGHVKYYLRACLYQEEQEKYEDVKEFKVLSPIDLNKMENVWTRPTRHLYEPVINKSWLFGSQKWKMEVGLERNAFTAGDIVNVKVAVWRRLNIFALKALLLMEIKSKMTSQTEEYKVDTKLVAFDEVYLTESHGRRKSHKLALKIPDILAIPNFEDCSFFNHRAVLQIIAVSRDIRRPDEKVEIDLILGHVPVEQHKLTRNFKGKTSVITYPNQSALTYSPQADIPTYYNGNIYPNQSSRLSSSISERESPHHFITRSSNSTPINAPPYTVGGTVSYPTEPTPRFVCDGDFSRMQYLPSAPPMEEIEELESSVMDTASSTSRDSSIVPSDSDVIHSDVPPTYEEALYLVPRENTSEPKVLVAC